MTARQEKSAAAEAPGANGRAAASELRKLGHTLGVDADALAFLSSVPAADVRRLRGQVAEALFEADRHLFARVAALSKAAPVAIAAKLAEHAFSPLLAARTAELIDPERAAALVAKLSDDYLADVSAAMDPMRSPQVVAGIEPERIARIGAELARREEWVVIAGFVDVVDRPALAATVRNFDGAQLLRIGFVLEDKGRLDEINTMVSDTQLDQMLAAAGEQGLWQELDDLLSHLTDERALRLADRFRDAREPVRRAVLAARGDGLLSQQALDRLAQDGTAA